MSMKPEFHCPPSMRPHVERVFRGEYEPGDYAFEKPPRVVDIGANLGAFSIWAARRWPGAAILAIEPHPDNFRLLCQNVAPWPVADCRRAAVADRESASVELYDGANNCGEASIYRREEQALGHQAVPVLHPRKLPPCDVLKVDAEGAEVEILDNYPHLSACTLVMLEAHGERDHDSLAHMLDQTHDCVRDEQTMKDRWTMVFRRREP